MNKTELIAKTAEITGVSKTKTAPLVDAVIEAIYEGLKEDGKVNVQGDFVLEVVPTAARKARNPKTGEEVLVPARNKIKFKAGSRLSQYVLGR